MRKLNSLYEAVTAKLLDNFPFLNIFRPNQQVDNQQSVLDPNKTMANEKTNYSMNASSILKIINKREIFKKNFKGNGKKRISVNFVIVISLILISCEAFLIFLIKNHKNIPDQYNLEEGSETTWIDYQESVTNGLVNPTKKILEISLTYFPEEKNMFITGLEIKNGFFQKNTIDEGEFSLILKKDNEELSKIAFNVPIQPLYPPPLEGEPIQENPLLIEIPFAITTEYAEEDEIRILDQNDNLMLSQKIENVPQSNNVPNFKTKTQKEVVQENNILSKAHNFLINIFSKQAKAQTAEYVDVVFIGSSYSSELLGKFHSDVEKYSSYLTNFIEPFRSRMSQITFHYVDNTSDLGCKYFGRAIICDNSKVVSAVNSSGVPNDTIIVIVNNSTYGGSSYIGGIATSYNGQYGQQVFAHELGHSFGRLYDEYIADYSVTINDEKNCFQGTPPNSNWENIVENDSYYSGCTFNNYHRSSPTSIMKELSSEYFNEISKYWINYYIDLYAGVFSDIVPTPLPTLTPTPTVGPTETPSPTPTASSSSNNDNESTSSSSSSSTSSPTSTPTAAPSATNTPIPSNSPTPTPTPTSIPTPSPSNDPLTLTYPTGGEVFKIGDNVHITWISNVSGTCSLDFYNSDVGFTNSVSNGIDCSQEYFDWTVYWPSCPMCPPPWPQSPPVDGYFRVNRWSSSDRDSTDTMSRINP